MKRAYRRYKKEVNLKRRARNYYDYSGATGISVWHDNLNWADYWKEVKSGEMGIWLRHTGKVCSCWMCSYDKYERPTGEEVRNIIKEQLE